MELIERTGFLAELQSQFERIADGEGHCVFVCGEAGIGKTSLVKAFCKGLKSEYNIYQGTCDALFTPRPLGPLFDIFLQLGKSLPEISSLIADRTSLFSSLLHELNHQKKTTLIVFEDIHWADEATLDFIKFLARRITQLRCLFILTYRDDEIHSRHPLRNVLGQLNPDSFTRLQLVPFSRQAVEKLAFEKGYSGEDVYSISGGNPFYVNEILASYSPGVPDNIKNAILAVYNRLDEDTRQVWETLSVLPTGFEINYLEKMAPSYASAVRNCFDSKILISKDGLIFFKHELYRRTIESSLSPLVRVALNKRILELFLETFEQNGQVERIIHHAKNANDYGLVARYAPMAARQAASVGAHIEASRLYLSAIEYYQGNDPEILIQYYESYAYECYLTNQIKEAIIYTQKSLDLWKKKNDTEKTGNGMRFLSRLWWLDGNRKNAETLGEAAIDVLNELPSSTTKAMAFSNMSQLKMLLDQPQACIFWGEKAIAIARELNDEETLSHAFNNVGSVQITIPASQQAGFGLLAQSLEIALRNSFHEHAARAYSNMASNGMKTRNYAFTKKALDEGIHYCEERDLDSWRSNMVSWKALLYLETGDWNEAYLIADNLVKNVNPSHSFTISALIVVATIKMRKGEAGALPLLLEAQKKAVETTELQRIIPTMIALLEYEWLTGKTVISADDLDRTKAMIEYSNYYVDNSKLAFWLLKTRKEQLPLRDVYEGYEVSNTANAQKAAQLWEKLGCPYGQALALFEGSDDDKRKAISIVHELGATAAYEKMKLEMRTSGIKSIPRGIRKTTRSNPAFLTGRELDILELLKQGLQNKEIAATLFISPKTVDHHISSILVKLDVNSRVKAVTEAVRLEILR